MEGSDGAHDLHRLVLIHGRERAREMVDVKTRPLVDIAADVLADESQRATLGEGLGSSLAA